MAAMLDLALVTTLALLGIELIITIPRTIKCFGLIIKLECVVKLLKMLTSTGLGETLQNREKIIVKTWPYVCIFERQKNVIRTEGLELDLQQNVIVQVKPKLDKLVQRIYDNASHLLFSKRMLEKCKMIETDAVEVQQLLDVQKVRGAN